LLVPIKHRLNEIAIQELLSYSIFPDPEQLELALNQYQMDASYELYGLEEDKLILGLVGFIMHNDNTLEIKHLAVDPKERGNGYGRGLILELITLKQPAIIQAETDEEAVDFYRNVGFAIVSLGELYPSVERFQCIFDVEHED
jgi:ribosomal protein S18 acetylase RimI-like enzyme